MKSVSMEETLNWFWRLRGEEGGSVVSVTTEFAWLPPSIAWSFCSLYRDVDPTYHKFSDAHLGLEGKQFAASIRVEVFCVGDRRSADDLGGMAPERQYLRSGLRKQKSCL